MGSLCFAQPKNTGGTLAAGATTRQGSPFISRAAVRSRFDVNSCD